MSLRRTDDEMVECPYDKTHRFLRKRLQQHLLKCRVNYPNVELQKCPFNQTHLIPEPEFVYHVTNCPDRRLITQYKYAEGDVKVEEEERVKQEPVESEENWDDTDVVDYNPQKYAEKANIIRRPEGVLPSQRKDFIKSERKRLGDYNSDDDDEKDSIKQLEDSKYNPVKKERIDGNVTVKKEELSDEEEDAQSLDTRHSESYYKRSHLRRSPLPAPVERRQMNVNYYYKQLPVRNSHPNYYGRFTSSPEQNNANAKCQKHYDLDDDPYYNRSNSITDRYTDYNEHNCSLEALEPPPPPRFFTESPNLQTTSHLANRGSYRGGRNLSHVQNRFQPYKYY